jgi:hypothetical protein
MEVSVRYSYSVACAPIVSCGGSLICDSTSAIGAYFTVGAIWYTGNVFVGPVRRDVTIVVLQVINAPRCEGRGVKSLVANRGRVSPTSLCTCTAIDANLETKCVYLGGYPVDSIRKLDWVRYYLSSDSISTRLHRPAIVN